MRVMIGRMESVFRSDVPPKNGIAIGKSSRLVNDDSEHFGKHARSYRSKLADNITITFYYHDVIRIHMPRESVKISHFRTKRRPAKSSVEHIGIVAICGVRKARGYIGHCKGEESSGSRPDAEMGAIFHFEQVSFMRMTQKCNFFTLQR